MSKMLGFWGKAQPRGSVVHWHPLAYHALDVAAVAAELLRRNSRLAMVVSERLGLDLQDAVALAVYLAAIHDIGKFSGAFQAKAPAAGECQIPVSFGMEPRHDIAGRAIMTDRVMTSAFSLKAKFPEDLDGLCWAALGHHGRPPQQPTGEALMALGEAGLRGANEFLDFAEAHFLKAETIRLNPIKGGVQQASWAIAGFVAIADWIGSDQTFFPYESPTLSLPEYWQNACKKAVIALDGCRLFPPNIKPVPGKPLQALAGLEKPTDLQKHMAERPLPVGPSLTIIEESTGGGKTEAALVWAWRLLAAGMADGLFLALPTMATSNAMYRRLSRAHQGIFGEESSFVLAHGKSRYELSLAGDRGMPRTRASLDGVGPNGESAGLSWVASENRKSLLADIGVGTIDQALAGVLRARHQSVRIYGLLGSVLIIDEAHAYDAYMSKEIETLLEFHAGLGGHAVILSATLTKKIKEEFLAGFARGAGIPAPKVSDESYPLVSSLDRAGFVETPISGRGEVTSGVAFLETENDVLALIEEASRSGSCAAWIRNTVNDAKKAFDALREAGLKPMLLHSRFAAADRASIEQEVMRVFGKASSFEDRRGRILVATQIVEQSLDIDFDVMVSDLAPMDLLIQRLGRLWRHNRPDRPAKRRELIILAPAEETVADENWLKSLLPGTAAVYPHLDILWKTADMLREGPTISMPSHARRLVEGAYDNVGVPEEIVIASEEAIIEDNIDRGIAKDSLLRFNEGYSADGRAWLQDEIVTTRLAESNVEIRLAIVDRTGIRPLVTGNWMGSSLQVARRLVDGEVECERVSALRRSNLVFGDRDVVVILTRDPGSEGESYSGSAMRRGRVIRVCYSSVEGFFVGN